MTPKEMQQKSKEKVEQIQSLMNLLKISAIPKRRLMPDGYLEDVIVFVDNENYPHTVEEPTQPVEEQPNTPTENA